jgi:putative ribosome biogenesis GTPase RsgA
MSESLAKGRRAGARAESFSLVENGLARDEPTARRLDLAARQQRLNRISTGARV